MIKRLKDNSFGDPVAEFPNQVNPLHPKIKSISKVFLSPHQRIRNGKRVQVSQSDLKEQYLRKESAKTFHVKW